MSSVATFARSSSIRAEVQSSYRDNQDELPLDVKVRPGRASDAQRAGQICYEAFKAIAERHGFPPDFANPETAIGLLASAISRADLFAFVAELNGEVVGSNFLWTDTAVAGVGPITVDTSVQNSGIGRHLMLAVIELAHRQGISAVRLVQAAYHNRSLSLYTKLGFVAREPLSVLQGPTLGLRVAGRTARPATNADLESANALSRRIHGHDRASELRHAVMRGSATVVEHAGRVTAYATEIGFFGHAVGETNEDLKALISGATSFSGPGFLLPTRNSELLRWCIENGLRVVQPMTLMSMGEYKDPAGAFLPSILY